MKASLQIELATASGQSRVLLPAKNNTDRSGALSWINAVAPERNISVDDFTFAYSIRQNPQRREQDDRSFIYHGSPRVVGAYIYGPGQGILKSVGKLSIDYHRNAFGSNEMQGTQKGQLKSVKGEDSWVRVTAAYGHRSKVRVP
ncbi:hypothetical protein [Olivibacter sitiensis]|uniref:hypothetical protein n=1 Tax=Olivibacter sitiensis TaxID=376470 RepID=UPI000422723D|nr:hypothetical protein [Olivibacter sitiensis]